MALPLVVVDLETPEDARVGSLVVASFHRHVAPERPLVVATAHDAAERLADPAALAAIVVTGSAAMLGDVDWADGLAAAVERAARAGVPVLGVCFAHQMLARHFGGEVRSFEAVRKGVPDITFQAAGPFAAETVPLVHTHRDHVAAVGPDMVPVATGGHGGVAALAHRSLPIWTCQGHPEWDADVCAHDDPFWERFRPDALDTPTAKDILRRFGRLADSHPKP